ncbi:MAG: hypothetical protein ABWY29_07205 [Blastococcus sp.]
MEIAVVYESLFGSTHEVADAIAEGVGEAMPDATVTCLRVADAAPDRVVPADLLFVGGPTHMHGMSSHMSRKLGLQSEVKKRTEHGDAAGHEPEPEAESPGLRDWFHQLPKAPEGRFAAAFDTRLGNRLAGGASSGIAHRLRRDRYEVVGEEGFIIEDADGSLRAGERDRARSWAAELVRRTVPSAGARPA